jgi:hypothetical protein
LLPGRPLLPASGADTNRLRECDNKSGKFSAELGSMAKLLFGAAGASVTLDPRDTGLLAGKAQP